MVKMQILLVFYSFITIISSATIDCSSGCGGTKNCDNTETCIVNCIGYSVCRGITINCPSNGHDCFVNCDGQFSCREILIDASSSGSLSVTADGAYNLATATIRCPVDTVPGFNNNCFVHSSGIGGEFNNMRIYAVEAFDDIDLKCLNYPCYQSGYLPTIYCTEDFSSSCTFTEYGGVDNWQCVTSTDICNNYLLPEPTEAPSYQNCEENGEIKHINWNELQNGVDNSAQIPYSNFSITLDKSKLELTFDINLEYVGNSSDGDFDLDYNLGTTFVIDFESFGTKGNVINEAGKCQNRLSSSFVGIAHFTNYWHYSEYPYLTNQINSNTYLSYPPPSQYWTLSIGDNTCSPINYYGVFSWNDLTQCVDFNGNDLINIYDYRDNITLSGTFYVSLVSPYSMSITDTGIYRTFPLIQQDFSISIMKQINVLSSTGIDLFISSIIGIYQQDGINKKYKISVLTQSADYIELTSPNMILTPFGGSTTASILSVTSSCLVASSFTCGQIFTITIDAPITCPPADLSGTYDISFTVTCPNGADADVCNTFLDDNSGSSIALSVDSNFIDNTCDVQTFNIIFDGTMQFYDDIGFSSIHDNANENYVIGQDTIYIKVEVIFPDDGSGDNYNIFGVEIDNVFVCTANDTVDLTQNLNQQNGAGGCLSSNIDADGPYNIIINGVINSDYSATIISNGDTTSNIVQFSFLTFNIGRSTMYIHTQLTLILQNGSRRRLLLSSSSESNSNQIRHFIDSTKVINQLILQTDAVSTTQSQNETDAASTSSLIMILVIITINIVFIIFG